MVFELALKALGVVLGPSWSRFGPSHEHPDSPKLKIWVTEVPWSSFLKDVSNEIMVRNGYSRVSATPVTPPSPHSLPLGSSGTLLVTLTGVPRRQIRFFCV